jgi:hypothetical protein
VCVLGGYMREGANAGQHTPTLSLPPSHRTILLCHNLYVPWYVPLVPWDTCTYLWSTGSMELQFRKLAAVNLGRAHHTPIPVHRTVLEEYQWKPQKPLPVDRNTEIQALPQQRQQRGKYHWDHCCTYVRVYVRTRVLVLSTMVLARVRTRVPWYGIPWSYTIPW